MDSIDENYFSKLLRQLPQRHVQQSARSENYAFAVLLAGLSRRQDYRLRSIKMGLPSSSTLAMTNLDTQLTLKIAYLAKRTRARR